MMIVLVQGKGCLMRTTIALDDDLVAHAEKLTGLREKAPLVRAALQALIERESSRRMARLGGSDPAAKAPPRRRPRASASRASALVAK